jgi:hypothetical protein
MLPQSWSDALEIGIHRASSELEAGEQAEAVTQEEASAETEDKSESAETQGQTQEASGETAGE